MIGYREWFILYSPETKQFRLSSVTSPTVIWEREMAAVCDQERLEEHLRNFEHECGLYSFRDPRDPVYFPLRSTLGAVVGSVYNYGIVAQYSEGFRSSHAVIDALFSLPYVCFQSIYGGCDKSVEFFGIKLGITPRARGYGLIDFYLLTCYCLEHMEKMRPRLREVIPVEATLREVSNYYGVPVRRWEELWKWT